MAYFKATYEHLLEGLRNSLSLFVEICLHRHWGLWNRKKNIVRIADLWGQSRTGNVQNVSKVPELDTGFLRHQPQEPSENMNVSCWDKSTLENFLIARLL
jgi:hypothetical protein